MSKIGYYLFVFFARLIGAMPFSWMYVFADFLYFLLKITGYRKDVILKNLSLSFPEKSIAEVEKLKNQYLKFMADYILESIKCITISEEEVLKRIRLVNKELLQKYKDQNRSCIATAGHYGNWEMCGLGASLMSPLQLIGVYKPLMNLDIENYMSKVRQKWGLKLVPMKQVVSAFEDNIRQMNAVYILVGDQSPSDPNKAYWTNFLNQDTAYHFGIEKYAHQYNLPVIFCKVIPEKRGYYCIELVELIDDPKKYKDTEITEICKNFLQDIIIENPVPWLWSHRRWKHQKPA